MKKISIVTPCYNEEQNIKALCEKVKEIMGTLPQYDYEHICIDNASTDATVGILRDLAREDHKIKVIVNSRNFGHIRSPYYGLLQSSGDAVILLVADFQDPPELILDFIKKWEEGADIVVGVKNQSMESPVMFFIRKAYYNFINRLSEIKLQKNFTGFGLYDKKIIAILRNIRDPYPYFRGLIFEIGYNVEKVDYVQPARKRGITKNNFYTLYDIAMLGISNHSKVPLRVATISGFFLSGLSFLIAMLYLVYKLIFWSEFSLGIAPVVIGLFFFASIQLFFIGIIGEYLGFIHTKVMDRPLVYEKERINFDEE